MKHFRLHFLRIYFQTCSNLKAEQLKQHFQKLHYVHYNWRSRDTRNPIIWIGWDRKSTYTCHMLNRKDCIKLHFICSCEDMRRAADSCSSNSSKKLVTSMSKNSCYVHVMLSCLELLAQILPSNGHVRMWEYIFV